MTPFSVYMAILCILLPAEGWKLHIVTSMHFGGFFGGEGSGLADVLNGGGLSFEDENAYKGGGGSKRGIFCGRPN